MVLPIKKWWIFPWRCHNQMVNFAQHFRRAASATDLGDLRPSASRKTRGAGFSSTYGSVLCGSGLYEPGDQKTIKNRWWIWRARGIFWMMNSMVYGWLDESIMALAKPTSLGCSKLRSKLMARVGSVRWTSSLFTQSNCTRGVGSSISMMRNYGNRHNHNISNYIM